jgi:hypothetical protein
VAIKDGPVAFRSQLSGDLAKRVRPAATTGQEDDAHRREFGVFGLQGCTCPGRGEPPTALGPSRSPRSAMRPSHRLLHHDDGLFLLCPNSFACGFLVAARGWGVFDARTTFA